MTCVTKPIFHYREREDQFSYLVFGDLVLEIKCSTCFLFSSSFLSFKNGNGKMEIVVENEIQAKADDGGRQGLG